MQHPRGKQLHVRAVLLGDGAESLRALRWGSQQVVVWCRIINHVGQVRGGGGVTSTDGWCGAGHGSSIIDDFVSDLLGDEGVEDDGEEQVGHKEASENHHKHEVDPCLGLSRLHQEIHGCSPIIEGERHQHHDARVAKVV